MTGTISPSGIATATPMCRRRWISRASSLKLLLASGTARIPAAIAWTKKGVKVSRTPCRSNSPRSRSRARTTAVMSASMTVVACGAVCLLSTMCLAMAWRIGESGSVVLSARSGVSADG